MNSIISQFEHFRNKVLDKLYFLMQNKSVFNRVFFILFFLCFSVFGFFLGRISKIFEDIPETSLEFLEKTTEMAGNSASPNFQPENFQNKKGFTIVASRQGKKYYFLWCSAGNNIKESNKVFFKTEEDAKRRGLTLAGNCK
jgi:hypothetical protein